MSNLILFTPKSYVIGLPIINADKHHKYSQEIVDMCKSGLSGCNLNLLDSEGLNGCILNFFKIFQNTPQLCWRDEWPTLSPGRLCRNVILRR